MMSDKREKMLMGRVSFDDCCQGRVAGCLRACDVACVFLCIGFANVSNKAGSVPVMRDLLSS
jgi:hypothetical protein